MTVCQCVCCQEEFEESFFCEKCSNRKELIEREYPNPLWNGYSDDEYYTKEEWEEQGCTCMNCCTCHLTKNHSTKNEK